MYDLFVRNVIQAYEDSSTIPVLCELSNGQLAVVKLNNNIQTNKALVNEFICAKLANLFGLPLPVAGIVTLDDRCKAESHISSANYGLCFYSSYIPKTLPLQRNILEMIENKQKLIDLILFDHIIYNHDRNPGNILVSAQNGKIGFYLIDHTHVFKNDCIWNKYSLAQGMDDADYNSVSLLEENCDTYSIIFSSKICNGHSLNIAKQSFLNILDESVLNDIYSDIPAPWKEFELGNDDYHVLSNYLLYRIEHLDDICQVICNAKGYNYEH